MHIERGTATGRITWVTLVGLVLVPLIVALGFLATTWHRDGRLGVGARGRSSTWTRR